MPEMSTSEAIRAALAQELERDDSVFLMGEDIGTYGGAFGVTRGLIDRFGPERIVNTPISEAGFVGLATGNALVGGRPVVEIMFSDFTFLAFDQLINSAAKFHWVYGKDVSVPLTVRTTGGTGRSYGPTHSQSIEAYLVHAPGIKVVVPSSPATAAGLLVSAIRDPNPVVVIENRMLYSVTGEVSAPIEPMPLGRARVVRQGEDITVVTYGRMVAEALAAAEVLHEQGISIEVVDLLTLSPMDDETVLASAERTGKALVVEEGNRTGGVAAEVGFRIFDALYEYLDGPVRRLAMPDVPVPFSPELEKAACPSGADIVATVRDILNP